MSSSEGTHDRSSRDEALYRALFDGSNDALFIEDGDGRILEVNARACELLGYTRDELLRLTVDDLKPAGAPRFLGKDADRQAQSSIRFETADRHKDGHDVPIEISARQIVIDGGPLWLIAARDIAERKRYERALAERSVQLARLNQLARALSQSVELEHIARIAIDEICTLPGFDAAFLSLLDESGGWAKPVCCAGVSTSFVAEFLAQAPIGAPPSVPAAATDTPTVIPDIANYSGLPDTARRSILEQNLHTLVLMPVVGEGRTLGVLGAAYARVVDVDETLAQLFGMAAGHVGQALVNMMRYQRERRHVDAQKALIDILSIAMESARPDDILPVLAEHAGRLVQADGAYITAWDEGMQTTIHAAAYGPFQEIYRTLPPVSPDEPTLTRAVLEAGHAIAVYDVFNSPYVRPSMALQFPTRSLLGLPLIAHGRRLGALLIASDTPRRFTPAEIELGQTAANLVALLIDNAQLLEAEQRERRRAETLSRTLASLNSSLELDVVLGAILDHLGQVVAYDSVSIQLIQDGVPEIVAGRGFPDMSIARQAARTVGVNSRLQKTLAARRAAVIPDTSSDPDWIAFPGQDYIRSWIGAPLFERDQLIGVLNVDHRQPNAYDEEAAELVTSFAHQAAIAITNARLYQQERERVGHLGVLTDIVSIASSTLELDELYQVLADNMVRVIGGDECYITRWDEAAQRAIPVAANATSRETYTSIEVLPGELTLTESAFSAGGPLAVDDAYDSPHISRRLVAMFPNRSLLALPLIADGRKLGAVIIGFQKPHRFTEEEIAGASRAAGLVSVAVAKSQLHADLKQHAQNLEAEVAERTLDLRAANEQLRSLDRLKTRLITQISHEFRTPLANLVTYLKLLTLGQPDKRDAYLDILNNQVEVLTRLINSVTVFAEVDLAAEMRAARPWPLADVVERCLATNRSGASARSIRIELTPPDRDLRVRSNPQRVGIALDEIISNAIAYTDAGGRVTISLEHVEEADRKWVRVSVSDTGVGIPADELPHVFEQFFRGRERALQVRGIGMGLSLVAAIAEAEGGRVTAESEGLPGRGSVFRLWLPASAE